MYNNIFTQRNKSKLTPFHTILLKKIIPRQRLTMQETRFATVRMSETWDAIGTPFYDVSVTNAIFDLITHFQHLEI